MGTIVINNKRYKKLETHQRIRNGAMCSIYKSPLLSLANPNDIGKIPNDFHPAKKFYNLVGEEIPHLKYDWNVIQEMPNISKGDLVKDCGLDKYTIDYALPQQWLNGFVEERNLDYDMVRSTTVMVYTDFHRHGILVSCCNEVQDQLDDMYHMEN